MGRSGRTTRRDFLKGAAAAGAAGPLLAALGRRTGAGQAPKRPNIVYFMTDDQRWDGLSITGNAVVETPCLDGLARQGALFENMFVTNSLCAPSRACYLTGKYSHVHGVRTNGTPWTEQPIFTDRLKKAGYQVCFIGKFHQGGKVLPAKADFWLGFTSQGQYHNPSLLDFDGRMKKETGHVTDLLGDRAVRYLKEFRKDPFCLLLWFKSPHRDWQPADRFKDLYAGKPVPHPPTFNTDYAGKPEAVRKTEMQVESAKGRMPFDDWVRDYYRCVKGVDENVGRVLQALKDLGLEEDTIVVFASDNGFFLGEFHFFDKRLMYEPSIRVPMLVRWPRLVRAGSRIREMALNVDLAPTLLDLAGLEAPADMQGASWKPLLEGRKVPWRPSWYYEYYEYPAVHMVRPNRGVRTERWKYIEWPAFKLDARGRRFDHPAEYELYDLAADPNEVTNLFGRPDQEAKVAELRAEMARLRKELRDPDVG
jgi:arylsulfatase A-like enzyme